MAEVLAVSGEYMPLARAMSRAYFAMERLSDVSFLYQYSLNFFLNIVQSVLARGAQDRSEEHTSELQSLMRISYAVFCLTKKNHTLHNYIHTLYRTLKYQQQYKNSMQTFIHYTLTVT